MEIVTSKEMRELESSAFEKKQAVSLKLMENAGVAIVVFLIKTFGSLKNKKIVIVCGKGNNGGDGFVAARLLNKQGIRAKAFLLAGKNECKGDAAINLKRLKKAGGRITEITGAKELKMLKLVSTKADIILDALLGTGFSGKIRGNLKTAVDIINSAGKTVVAVDIPSGLRVKADYTLTLGLPKLELLDGKGINASGRLEVADIGLPGGVRTGLYYTECSDVKPVFGKKETDSNKGSTGRVLVIGGSVGLTGAPCLSALASLRSGSGLVTVSCAKSLYTIIGRKLTEVMTRPVSENCDGSLSSKAFPALIKLLAGHEALVLGPGLGKNKDTGKLVKRLLLNLKVPVVLDADGLNLIAGARDILTKASCKIVITPHPGEMARLTGLSIGAVQRNRIDTALAFSKKYKVVTVLKGARTVIAFPDDRAFVNSTGNPGMATAGAGDVLSGVIGSLLARGITPEKAAVAGVFIHGLAGDLAAEEKGEYGLIASDIVEKLPYAISSVRKCK